MSAMIASLSRHLPRKAAQRVMLAASSAGLLSLVLLSCGSEDSCAGSNDISGTWSDGVQTTYRLTQSCDGAVSGTREVVADTGALLGRWIIDGQVEGSRFLWTGTCADDGCTYRVYTAEGSNGTGYDIIDDDTMVGTVDPDPSRASFSETLERQ